MPFVVFCGISEDQNLWSYFWIQSALQYLVAEVSKQHGNIWSLYSCFLGSISALHLSRDSTVNYYACICFFLKSGDRLDTSILDHFYSAPMKVLRSGMQPQSLSITSCVCIVAYISHLECNLHPRLSSRAVVAQVGTRPIIRCDCGAQSTAVLQINIKTS